MNFFKKGDLVIVYKDCFGLEEKWFIDDDFKEKTIYDNDNIFIPKHTVGFFVEYINWAAPAAMICWGGDLKGKKLVLTLDKFYLLDEFLKELDENE